MRFLLPILLIFIANASASTIVVTVPDFAPIAKAIAGEGYEVYSLLPPNTDPHSYSLKVEDLQKLRGARLIILANSKLMDFEKEISEEFQNVLDFPDYKVELQDCANFRKNPHGYWMLPENAIKIAEAIKDRLSRIDPDNKTRFEENFRIFVQRVEEAYGEAMKIIKDEAGKKFVAMVPCVCYIPKAYKISIEAVLFPEETGAASASEIEEIRRKLESGELSGIIIPESMRGGKGEELAEELAKSGSVKVAWVGIFSDSAYDAMLISNAARIAYAEKVKKVDSSFWTYLLSAICLLEAAIIVYLYRLRE